MIIFLYIKKIWNTGHIFMLPCVFLFLNISVLHAQNLVPNPSFENFNDYRDPYLSLPSQGFPGVKKWYRHTLNFGLIWSDSAMQVNPSDKQFYRPFHGQAYARLTLWNHPFFGPVHNTTIQAVLNDSLDPDCYYRFTMYVLPEAIYPIEPDPYDPNSASANYGSTKSIGAYFSKEAIFDTLSPKGHSFDSIHIMPQVRVPQNNYITDTTNYTKVSGIFKAEGGEKYITLGYFGWVDTMLIYKFHDQQIYGSNAGWRLNMLIDSLNLYKIPPPDTLLTSSRDTSMCPGDSLNLFTHAREALYLQWDNGSIDSIRTITQPGTYWVNAYYPCGDILSDTIVVHSNDVLPPITIGDTTICEGEIVNYNLPLGAGYLLNGDSVGSSFSLSTEGNYLLHAYTQCEEKDFNFSVNFKAVNALPEINIPDTAICAGEEALFPLPKGFDYTLNGNKTGNDLLIKNQGEYVLTANNDCESRSYAFSIHDKGCKTKIFIPNAFTPNNDGLNDCFAVSVIQFKTYSIMIFNRWGQLVYQSDDPEKCWDGRYKDRIKADIYTFKISVNNGNEVVEEYGTVNLIR